MDVDATSTWENYSASAAAHQPRGGSKGISEARQRKAFRDSDDRRSPAPARIRLGLPRSNHGFASLVEPATLRFWNGGLQALHLAMQFASVTLETSGYELEWLGEKGDLGFPRFLPDLPRSRQDRFERIVEREVARCDAVAKRRAERTKGAGRRGTSS